LSQLRRPVFGLPVDPADRPIINGTTVHDGATVIDRAAINDATDRAAVNDAANRAAIHHATHRAAAIVLGVGGVGRRQVASRIQRLKGGLNRRRGRSRLGLGHRKSGYGCKSKQ
jgi:hypothetical protein